MLQFHHFRIIILSILAQIDKYTLFAVRNEPKPVLKYPSIRIRLSTYLNANYGHFKIRFFQKDKRILENNGSLLAANRVYRRVRLARGTFYHIPQNILSRYVPTT